jgi:hypothetical protein
MSSTTDSSADQPRVYVHVDQEDGGKYSILSSDLERIGTQLRGRVRFSIFNSIILPALVTLVTLASTSLFQFISWQNSIRVQAASDEVGAAGKTYNKAATEIDKRYYATFLFNAAVKSLAERRANQDAGDDLINKYDIDQQRQRFKDFYAELASWNDNYNQMLDDLSYDLDRPLDPGKWTETGYSIVKEKLNKISCDAKSLPDEIESKQLDKFAVATQFAVINRCFGEALGQFSVVKDQTLTNKTKTISPTEYADAHDRLDNVRVLLNQFRCFANARVHFLGARKERTLFFANWFVDESWYVKDHLSDTIKKCSV